jgi:hypothetical protein
MRALVLGLLLGAVGCDWTLIGGPPHHEREVVWARGDEQLVFDETVYDTFPDGSIEYELRLEGPDEPRVMASGWLPDHGADAVKQRAILDAIARLPPL